MKQTLEIAPGLALPLEAITNTFAIFGIRGSGKSNLGAVMAEKIIEAGQPVCIIDPTGAWYGLKSSRDGKSPGLPVYVFGGEHADVPLEPTSGEVLANFAVENRVPMVLDLRLMRKHEQVKFVLTFAETLFHRNREPLMVMVDEAARFAPQIIKDRSPDAARCLGAMEDLATLGRNRGLGVTLMAQRPAPVSTTLRTQMENLICLRTIGKHDRKAIDEWVEAKGSQKERDEMMADLASLPDGSGYFWSPTWMCKFVKVHFFQRQTFDSGATPKIGQKTITPRAFAEIDKQKLSAEIQSTIERAKADDPKELRRQIAELKKQVAKPALASAPQIKRVEVMVLKDSQISKLEVATEKVQKAGEAALLIWREMADALRSVKSAAPVTQGLNRLPDQRPRAVERPAQATPKHQSNGSAPAGNLTGPEQRILDSIAWFEDLGIQAPEQTAVAFMAGYTAGGGAFNNPRGALRGAGMVDYLPGDRIGLTDRGREFANRTSVPATAEELQQRVLGRLPGPEQKILNVAIAKYPESIPNDECARAAGYEPGGGAFNNPRGRLRSLGLIEYPSPGKIQARPLLFLE